MAEDKRSRLGKLVSYFGLLLIAALVYVLLDFAIDLRPPQVQSSYRFSLGELVEDRPSILRRDNLSILVIRRSAATIDRLQQAASDLQDPLSRDSRQPAYANNRLRSRRPDWFVSYAIGTDLGCALEVMTTELKEICGEARYDFAGRAITGNRVFQNLSIPDYNFASDFSSLTIKP